MTKRKVTGKTFKLQTSYPNVKFEATTVNYKPLKTINLETRFWFDKDEPGKTSRELEIMFRKCKRTLFFEGGGWFDPDKLISIKDIPADLTTGTTSKVFTMFEFTIFPTIQPQSDVHMSSLLTDLTDKLYNNVFSDRHEVSKSKRD